MHDKQAIIENLIHIWQEDEITKSMPAEGRSMFPLIINGDRLKIRFIKPEIAKAGDIAVFRRDNATIVHRIIKKCGEGFIEKGDFQIKGGYLNRYNIIGKIEIQPELLNHFMALWGYMIYRLGIIAKPLLILPFIINAGTRIYLKLRSH